MTERNAETRKPLCVAFGGGVNSTAMLIGMVERGIIPDWVLFSDTGGERSETYANSIRLALWLYEKGVPNWQWLTKNSRYVSLEDECLTRNTMPSIVYGWRSCSDKWKQEPQRKYMNHDPLALSVWKEGGRITKAIGFGVDEMRRAKEFEDKKYVNWYPLIEWGWNRAACIKAIEQAGMKVPGKSACFYCPASTKKDVIRLSQEHPDLYERAIAMESNATTAHTAKGLGRHFSWRDLVGPETVEQACMCFDGEE